jgi:cellulose synthase/poly-beta-1,6-N-acetylglucosamine synthase-like glycosyltransferase
MYDPKIAVLIPAHNEELVIERTIRSLVQSDCYKKDIYVVDDKSTDNTYNIATACGVNVLSLQVNKGKAQAQADALKHFNLTERYDWVIFLDGDTRVDPYFYTAMYEAAKTNPSISLYVGQIRSEANNNIYSASRAFDYTYSQDVAKQGQSNFNVVYVAPGCSSMYCSDILKSLHLDSNTLAEDMDLTMQVHRLGGKVVYLPQAIVNTQDPNNFKDYVKQNLRWFRGYWQVALKHKVFGWRKKQLVDIYMILLTLDTLIYNRILWILLIAITDSSILWVLLLLDMLVVGLIATYSFYRTKRLDVLLKFPVYYWLSFIGLYAYIRSFVEIVLQRKTILAWNKVTRF